MNKFFFTFGTGWPYRRKYVEIHAPDSEKAREMMNDAHGTRWGFQYDEKEFEGQVEQWGLTRLSLLSISPRGDTVCELKRTQDIPLLDIHGALSHLTYAVQLELDDLNPSIDIRWDQHRNLYARVEVALKNRQKAVDRLNRGAIHGEYDYRFSVCYTPTCTDSRQVIEAYVNLSHKGQTS